MICVSNCIKAKCLAAPVYCDVDDYTPVAQELVLGVLEIDTDYTMYIQDQNSGVVRKINLTSNGTGYLAFDMNDYPYFFHPNTTYCIWVTLVDAGLTDTEDITFSAYDIYPCVIVEFVKVSEDSSTLAGLSSQTISL